MDGGRRPPPARAGAPPRRAPGQRRAAQPLLGRHPRAAPRVLPRGRGARPLAAGGPPRAALPEHPRGCREWLGLLEPVDARPEGPADARGDRPRAGGPQQPPLPRRAHDRGAASRAWRRGRRAGGRALRRARGGPPSRARRRRMGRWRGVLLRRPLEVGRARDGPPDARRGVGALLRARDAGAGQGRRAAARARLPQAGRLRDDADRVGAAVGRAQRVAAAAVARDGGRAALRARRPGRRGARALARDQPPHLSNDGQDDGEVRRGGHHPPRGWRRVPDAGRLRLEQRRRAAPERAGAAGAPRADAIAVARR